MPFSGPWPLREAIARLEEFHGRPKPFQPIDPFEMILWENCAYLVDDRRRGAVFQRLKHATGNSPERIAAMKRGVLADLITEDGGMRPPMRAGKLKRAADLALDIGVAELRARCRTDPAAARRALKKFPGIGDPGADKILMASRSLATLAPESNGLRVLIRIGFGQVFPDYTTTYRTCAHAVNPELPADPGWLVRAHQLLRLHGQTLCKVSAPDCASCPLEARCPAAR